MNNPCPNKANACDCSAEENPISNFSSEAPEEIDFRNPLWPNYTVLLGQDPDDSGDGGHPPIACEDFIRSVGLEPTPEIISIICGECSSTGFCSPPGPVPGTNTQIFYSAAQGCSSPCPDGSLFTATVAPATFYGFTQAEADQRAASYACKVSAILKVCLSDLSARACLDSPYADTITASRTGTWNFSLSGGALPPGLTLTAGPQSYQCTISGTPTATGSYSFSVMASGAAGVATFKTYSIIVVGITTASPLPGATSGTAYNQTLTADGGTAPYTFSLELGALPTGLTLASDGTISGTTTDTGDFTFTVSVTDSANNFCTKEFALTVATACDAATDWQNAPGTCRLRIKNYNPADWVLGAGCATCIGSADPEWDGTFPIFQLAPLAQYFMAPGQSINGAAPLLTSCDCGYYPGPPFAGWFVELACSDGLGGGSYMYTTFLKPAGSSPIGVYTKSSGCSGPATIEIEAYSL